ncbi:PA domain-containing protein [Nonomuraea sp. NPDC049695]|uniref:PA domain-containing protein n=1 Tax=Nonomuraea sp. NPDC049695 TaxID=3154734 RepID=UPI0034245A26
MGVRTTLAPTGLTAVLLACCTTMPATASTTTPAVARAGVVDVQAVQGHLRQLQKIADANGGHCGSLSAGAEQTAEYIAARLRESGYEPVIQRFPYVRLEERSASVLEQTAPETRQYTRGTDFGTLPVAGTGDVTAPLTVVKPGPADCRDDWTAFPKGTVALVEVGSGCDPVRKARDAETAGAAAVLVHRTGITAARERSDPGDGTDTPEIAIPALVVSPQVASAFTGAGPLTLRVKADQRWFQRGTAVNVLADTGQGSADSTVMAGAHLDSVEGTDPPAGSEQIERVLTGYFAREGLPTTPVRIHGGSDHRPFAAAAIPWAGWRPVRTSSRPRNKPRSSAGRPANPTTPATTAVAMICGTSTPGSWARWPVAPRTPSGISRPPRRCCTPEGRRGGRGLAVTPTGREKDTGCPAVVRPPPSAITRSTP